MAIRFLCTAVIGGGECCGSGLPAAIKYVEGEPASAVQQKYQQGVISGVGDWLKVLSAHIPAHEVVNTCVSFYYERGMVSLAALIIDSFPNEAICPGTFEEPFRLPDDLSVTDAHGRLHGKLAGLKGEKTIAVVSDDCPVSMAAAVVKARERVSSKASTPLIVASLQKLSATHRGMARLIRGEKILFINDVVSDSQKPANRPRLPLLLDVE